MNDLTRVIKACQRSGLLYVHGGRHHKIVNPTTGRAVPISSTPSCRNAHRAVLRDVRRYLGVEVTP